MNIYIGNLTYGIDDEGLKVVFSQYGEVLSAKVIVDKYSGKSKGFGFVEMADEASGTAAIEALNGNDLQGRVVKVSRARDKSEE